jgi:hypothetical protein
MDEAVDAMKAAGLYRQQVKRDAQRAIEEYHKYEKLCIDWFKGYKDDRYYLWQDLIGKATERLEHKKKTREEMNPFGSLGVLNLWK